MTLELRSCTVPEDHVKKEIGKQQLCIKRIVFYTIVYFEVIPGLVHYKGFLSKYREWHLL